MSRNGKQLAVRPARETIAESNGFRVDLDSTGRFHLMAPDGVPETGVTSVQLLDLRAVIDTAVLNHFVIPSLNKG